MSIETSFTKRAFEQLEIGQKRFRIADFGHRDSINGLILDVFPSGKKVFRFRRKHLGKDVTVTIGEFPHLTIENARKQAKHIAVDLAEGVNPNEAKRLAKLEAERKEALSISVQQLFDSFEAEFMVKIKTGERRLNSLKDIQSTWKNHIQPRIAHLPVESITTVEAENLLKLIITKNSAAVRNKCLTLLKSMFNEQAINPFGRIKKLAAFKRERILNQHEVRALLESLEFEPPLYRDVVMLLLLTGQRKSCVFSMEWREIDHQRGVWIIPTSKIKSKKPHAVPLTKEVIAILERRSHEAVQGDKYVFPAERSHSGHITENAGKGSFWYRITERAGLRSPEKSATAKEDNVTIHDLRRTIASWSVMRGGNIQTTSKLLGHSDISITASTYAHLDIENVRAELGITTAHLLGTYVQESRVDRLVRDIKQLSSDEKRELFSMISNLS
ncbi:tyrosine-type recombinase/integrase [Shewanella baltica]|uniref:tyrosine-type recombinase/integrase n=1 Tax=Shewanella baltica TaxID=62322 RepID=UPI00217F04C1|nr:tyrosine-type recombinase/integrase [Shewanella baltica]MCS6118647.1 tyrosine-type recombinase/integrase [Shewanella baltica]